MPLSDDNITAATVSITATLIFNMHRTHTQPNTKYNTYHTHSHIPQLFWLYSLLW